MRIDLALLLALVLVACAGASLAADTGHRQPTKPSAGVVPNVPAPERQGGDTIGDAVVIPAIPFADTGSTTGFNDDSYPDDVSLPENLPLVGGATYFVVIDGYGGDHGDYVISIVEFVPCVLECPPEGLPEGEPPIEDGYADDYNGGCNVPEYDNPFQHLYGDADGILVFCGVAGWYLMNDQTWRDTDWFVLHAGPTGSVEVTGDAELPTYLFELPHDCNVASVIQSIEIGDCAPNSMVMSYSPDGIIWLWAGSTTFAAPGPGWGHEYDYVLWFSGLAPQPVATETATWTAVKSLFE